MVLPQEYIVQKFFQYNGSVKYNRGSNYYNGSCGICKEGNSWLKKKRAYYFPEKNYIYCHNCNRSWNPYNWLIQISGLSRIDIQKEIDEGNFEPHIIETINTPKKHVPPLPHDSINIFDPQQIEYYKKDKIFNDCLNYVKARKLDIAINKPKTFFISLTDFIHKNRLIIPYYDINNKIIFYQTRDIYGKEPRYLTKLHGQKSIFNINNINPELDNIFIFEGPINCCFVKNGIAVGGLTLTSFQKEQLQPFTFFKKIWVPDCQYIDKAGYDNTKILLNRGETVFIWPSKYNKFKDINDICINFNLNQISVEFFKKNAFSGKEGIQRLHDITLGQ
jgi:hypothetical protein